MADSCAVCDKKVAVKCGGCGKVLYCSEDHKKENFALHKTDCKPYRIEKSSKYGRYLVASRDVKPGELLLRERPVTVGPRVDSLPACLECFSLMYPPLSRCPVCGVTPLCARCTHNSLECQFYSSLSQEHKDLCLRSTNQYVLPLRILLHLKSKNTSSDHFRNVLEMESHLDARKGTDVWFSHQKNVVELLQSIGVISNSKEDVELVQKICGVLDVNSFEVRGAMGLGGRGMRLRGVYHEAALMAHDCITNVHLSVDDNFVMCIRASVDILEGQPILYNYTDPLQTTYERQKHLRYGKYFFCSCKRCEDPTELGTYIGGVKCPRCRAGYILSSSEQSWSCQKCSRNFSSGLIAVTTLVARERLEAVDRSDPYQLELILTRLASTFSPNHSIIIDVKQSIIAAYRELEPTKEIIQRKVELCTELLPILRIIEPGISRLRGITLYELHIGLVLLAQDFGEPERLREAEEVLKEAVGLLLYEPTASPEGELARQAMSELKALKQMISKQELKDKKKKKIKHKK